MAPPYAQTYAEYLRTSLTQDIKIGMVLLELITEVAS